MLASASAARRWVRAGGRHQQGFLFAGQFALRAGTHLLAQRPLLAVDHAGCGEVADDVGDRRLQRPLGPPPEGSVRARASVRLRTIPTPSKRHQTPEPGRSGPPDWAELTGVAPRAYICRCPFRREARRMILQPGWGSSGTGGGNSLDAWSGCLIDLRYFTCDASHGDRVAGSALTSRFPPSLPSPSPSHTTLDCLTRLPARASTNHRVPSRTRS